MSEQVNRKFPLSNTMVQLSTPALKLPMTKFSNAVRSKMHTLLGILYALVMLTQVTCYCLYMYF